MKKLAIVITAFILSLNLKGQITLEHQFTGENGYVWSFNTSTKTFYYLYDEKQNQFKIFNSDYSVYKTVNINVPSGYVYAQAFEYQYSNYFSDKLFNNDDLLEFLVCFYKSGNPSSWIWQIYNENGTLVYDFGEAGIVSVYKTASNKAKLNVLKYNNTGNYTNDIYSLPGTYLTGNKSLESDSNINPAFPNPADKYINLTYSLEKGQIAVMKIFNISGQLIDVKQIDATFNMIRLNVESYQPGVYTYEYNGISNKFIVK